MIIIIGNILNYGHLKERINYDKCPYCYAQEVLNNK